MKPSKQHLAELVAILATEPDGGHRPPHLIAQDALKLLRLGARAATLSVRLCNGEGWHGRGWNDADEKCYEKSRERILRDCNGIAAHYNATCTLGGDPRGYVLKLQLKTKRNNTFGNDGWGIA